MFPRTCKFRSRCPRRKDSNATLSDIPLVLTAFLLWKFIKKTKIVPLSEIPLREALADVDRYPEMPEPEAKGWKKALNILWD